MTNQQLVNYVAQNLSAGIPEDEVKRTLAGVGWQTTDIEDAFSTLKGEKPDIMPDRNENRSGGVLGDGSMMQAFDLGLPETTDMAKTTQVPNTESRDQSRSEVPVQPFPPMTAQDTGKSVKENNEVSVNNNTRVSPAAILFKVGIVFLLTCGGAFLAWWWFNGSTEVPLNVPAVVNNPIVEPTIKKIENTNSGLAETEYVSSKGFKIRIPNNWMIDESGLFGTLVIFTNPLVDEDEGNKYAANINVVMESSQTSEISEYVEISRENLEKTFSFYKKTGERSVMINDQPAVLLESEYETGVYKMHSMQLVVKRDEAFYVVTATALASKWDVHKNIIEEALMTFR